MHPAIYWIIGGLLGLILEMLVPAFVIASFAIGAFFAALAAWLGASAAVQVVVFAVSGFFIVIPARRYLRHRSPRMRLGAETLPGKLAVCLEPVDGDLQAGVVMLDGARWTAVAARGTRIERGATVEVLAVEGVRVIVALPGTAASPRPTTPGDAA